MGSELGSTILILGGTIMAAIWLVVDARRRGGRGGFIAMGVVDLVSGLLNFALISIHLAAVLRRALRVDPFVYDFRFVSLILVGLFIAVPGVVCAWTARGIASGDHAAWWRAVWATLVLLAVNGALMPLQMPAVVLGSLAGVNLVALLALGRWRAAGERDLDVSG